MPKRLPKENYLLGLETLTLILDYNHEGMATLVSCLLNSSPNLKYLLIKVSPNNFFFERTAQDSACFIDIEEKNTRLRLWEAIAMQQKRKEKNNAPGWIGASTRVPLKRPVGLGPRHDHTKTHYYTSPLPGRRRNRSARPPAHT
jgi:hypothetical protein